MRHILVVVVNFNSGGIESFLCNVLKSWLSTEKLCIDLLCNRIEKGDIFSIRLKAMSAHIHTYGGTLCYSPFFYLPRLFWLMKKFGPYDVAYANAGLLNGFIVFFGYLLHIEKRISHLHAQEKPSSLLQRLKKLVCGWLIRHFATIHFAPSKAVLQCFNLPLIPNKIIRNGIDTQQFSFDLVIRQEFRAKLGVKNKLLIGHVGRFDKVKNHTFLLQIFKHLHACHAQSSLLLIGAGEGLTAIRKEVEKLHLEKDVIILTDAHPVSPYYQAMDAFVFPSLREGFGIVAIEAQCAGLPCFISDGVPKEVMICNTTQIPLAKSAEQWAEVILAKTKSFQRADCCEQIKKAGYDIHDTIRQLQEEFL